MDKNLFQQLPKMDVLLAHPAFVAAQDEGMPYHALKEAARAVLDELRQGILDGAVTALPSLDNLQALAAALDVGVEELLGSDAGESGAPEPTLTLDALRALLEARDAEKQRRTRIWGGAALGVALVLVCVLVGVAYQYDRQVQALQQSYAMMQANFSTTQSELSA